ncbi:hypothetical protein CANARDRAFT_196726 [[Candida] arabinofermentans NRRL YB-2248]|uniref:Mitochondrial import inner membrane translocase subunit n=1 Tax=[Candida] arabinofermentans NRRL YB-2248 TaxID=983967 RepID=A0A1E4T3P4_9ASCO|nr:hypothetical protein CANARDRAFT_196726 [[Candida] arabinofermentans NRRL YB-2248]
MSFFLNQPALSSSSVDPVKLKLAEIQYDALASTLEVVQKQCSIKCVPLDYGEPDLNKGEATCTDRCVSKFMMANRIIGAVAQQRGLDERDLRHIEQIKRDYLSGRPEDS